MPFAFSLPALPTYLLSIVRLLCGGGYQGGWCWLGRGGGGAAVVTVPVPPPRWGGAATQTNTLECSILNDADNGQRHRGRDIDTDTDRRRWRRSCLVSALLSSAILYPTIIYYTILYSRCGGDRRRPEGEWVKWPRSRSLFPAPRRSFCCSDPAGTITRKSSAPGLLVVGHSLVPVNNGHLLDRCLYSVQVRAPGIHRLPSSTWSHPSPLPPPSPPHLCTEHTLPQDTQSH
ncbi:uncharacterized protein LOC116978434 [Amblyraja radiata]|uniref:uncharacterized protein LOC116978434 n=1 Tax=Amblyraja radiata TaxID=386614 RepID=UPI0014028420|nr:uncharacterized protein LOC116978434 [Amblyraja radiata]